MRDRMAHARGYRPPDVGGIAMADGVVIHASNQAQRGAHVSAFGVERGEPLWRVETTTPESSPAIADGYVHAIELPLGAKTDRLVARALATGEIIWSRELAHARGPAPLLAGPLVVVHGDEGLFAFDRASGDPAWSATLPRTTPAAQGATTLAAALGSGTLVVCAGGMVHVLRLTDGATVWTSGPLGKAVDSPAIAAGALYVTVDGGVVRLDGDGDLGRTHQAGPLAAWDW
jgi:outer membrane protein assembly factor BamB